MRMAPRDWEDQYELTGVKVPPRACGRFGTAFLTDKEHDGSHGNMKIGDSSKKNLV